MGDRYCIFMYAFLTAVKHCSSLISALRLYLSLKRRVDEDVVADRCRSLDPRFLVTDGHYLMW